MKKFAALAMAAAFAVGFVGPTASAGHCETQTGPSVGEADGIENPATGGYLYADADAGAAGISGDAGYLEVRGDADGNVQVHGHQTDTGVHGSIGTEEQCLPEA